MNDIEPKSGYDLAAKILETHPTDAIETMLKYSNGAEADWLEFKAGMTLQPEDEKKGDKPDDLYWDYILSIVAMANTRGGAFVIGVNDKTHEAVPLESCDKGHVIEKRGKEAYLREVVVNNLDRPDRKWTTKDRVVWSLPQSIVPSLEKRIMPYGGTDVIVILVPPRKLGDEFFVRSKTGLGEFKQLPVRDIGEIGHVKRLTMDDAFAEHRAARENLLLTTQLGVWWDELDAEVKADAEDAELDEAIRAYYADLEAKTKKRLQAFVPLDAAGDGEADEEDEPEFEDPTAVSVFDEDDEPDSNESKALQDEDADESEESESDDDGDDDSEDESDEPKSIRMGLTELLGQCDRVVLSGEPGAGKTTCLAHFAVEHGKEQGDHPRLFAFVQLGRWAAGGSVLGLVGKACGLTLSQIDALLEQKRLHLVLDALNECPDHLRPAALENIRVLVREHPDLPVVLSMRRVEALHLPGFPVFEVQAMDRDRQRQFLERHLGSADKAAAILNALEQQPGGASIAQNPMLLKMVVDVVRNAESLPSGRATLYRAWLGKWYDREEKKARKAKAALPWTAAEAMRLLARMAFAGRAQGYRDIPLDLARQSLDDADGTILDRLCQGPLLDLEEDFVHFRHETFQEYLCAEWLLAEPTALDALPEKDYDTWGMPIAYAAELRLPGKLPEQLSEAVWEMNSWVASLVVPSPAPWSGKPDVLRPDRVLANALFQNEYLLSESLHASFQKEFAEGCLFLQVDAPLQYLVFLSEETKRQWQTFECAYILNNPKQNEAIRDFLDGGISPNYYKKSKKHHRLSLEKIRSLLFLSGKTFVSQAIKSFPEVSMDSVVQSLRWWAMDLGHKGLRKFFPNFSPIPVEAMSLLSAKIWFKKKYVREAKWLNTINALALLFGQDFIQKMLVSIKTHPSLWMCPDTYLLLNFARDQGYDVHEAARRFLVGIAKELEEIGATKIIVPYSLLRHLDESDVPEIMPCLTEYGRALLQRFGFNPGEHCTPYYNELPTAGSVLFEENDLQDEIKRRNISTILLHQDFLMTVAKCSSRTIILSCLNFSAPIPSFVKLVDVFAQCYKGAQCLVRVDIAYDRSKSRYYFINNLLKVMSTEKDITSKQLELSEPEPIATKTNPNDSGQKQRLLSLTPTTDLGQGDNNTGVSDNRAVPSPLKNNEVRTNDSFQNGFSMLSDHTISNPAEHENNGDGTADHGDNAMVNDDTIVHNQNAYYHERLLGNASYREKVSRQFVGQVFGFAVASTSDSGAMLTSPAFAGPVLCHRAVCPEILKSTGAQVDAEVTLRYQAKTNTWAFAIKKVLSISGVPYSGTALDLKTHSVISNEDSRGSPSAKGPAKGQTSTLVNVPVIDSKEKKTSSASPSPSQMDAPYRNSDLIDPIKRKRVLSELKNKCWEMVVSKASRTKRTVWFAHPSFAEEIPCKLKLTKYDQYEDRFSAGNNWSVTVQVQLNSEGTLCFVAQIITPPSSIVSNSTNIKKRKSKIAQSAQKVVVSRPLETTTIPSAIHIYIDEAWPGNQDYSKKDIGVIAGIVWMDGSPNYNVLPKIATHLRRSGGDALQKLLMCKKAFPFAFPIRFPAAFSPNVEAYRKLFEDAIVILLGWVLPQPNSPTKVFIHAEHFSTLEDGTDETDYFRALLAGASMMQITNRLSRWSVEKVEWQDKPFEYIPYGDLVGYLFAETSDSKPMAKEFQVEQWAGCVPFSDKLLPVLRDLDAADPASAAGSLFFLSQLCGRSQLFRHSLRSILDSARQQPELRNAILRRLCEEYEKKDRNLRRIERIANAFFETFPDEKFADQPKLRFQRLLAALQQANHDGNPAAADEAFRSYDVLRADMMKRDMELCAYADLNVAVHFNDRFEFGKAEALLRPCRDAPSFAFLSAQNRGRLLSSLGQSAALQGRYEEAESLFREALDALAELGNELEEEADQTRVYRAFAALDAKDPDIQARLMDALGMPLAKVVKKHDAVTGLPYHEHLLVKALWVLTLRRSAQANEWVASYFSTRSFGTVSPQHPWELILLYRGLLAWKTDSVFANQCFDGWEDWFDNVPHGGTLSLIQGFGLVAMHRHCGKALDKAALEALLRPIAKSLPETAPTVDSLLRIATDDSPESLVELWTLMPFNYK